MNRRTLMDLELGTTSGVAFGRQFLFTWRCLMRRTIWPSYSDCIAARLWLVFGLLAPLAVLGCGHQSRIEFSDVAKPLPVQVINPPLRNIVRVVGQPSFIESYERTSIYPKPTAYIDKWNVDIGDKVKKGDVLAILSHPN